MAVRPSVGDTLDFAAAVFAIVAAAFWFLSAFGGLPPMRAYFDHAPDNDPFFIAMRFSANMNVVAAALSGLSALCFGIKLLWFK
jgi:hypothetical protein